MSGVVYTATGLAIVAAIIAATPQEIARMPTLTTLLQVGQILAILGAGGVVFMKIGRSDQVLKQLAEARIEDKLERAKLADVIHSVALSVAKIDGQLNPSKQQRPGRES